MKILDDKDPRYLVESTEGETFELRFDSSTLLTYKNGEVVDRTVLGQQQPLDYIISKFEKPVKPMTKTDQRLLRKFVKDGVPCFGLIDPGPGASAEEQIREQYGFLNEQMKAGEELRWHRAAAELYILFDITNNRKYLAASDRADIALDVAKPRDKK